MGNPTRGVAYVFVAVFLTGTAVGSTLPETGNFVAKFLSLPSHTFNIVFLVVGITGIMLALYTGFKRYS